MTSFSIFKKNYLFGYKVNEKAIVQRLKCLVGTYFATGCVCFSTLQERTFLTYLLVALLALAARVRERAIVDTSEDTYRPRAHVA